MRKGLVGDRHAEEIAQRCQASPTSKTKTSGHSQAMPRATCCGATGETRPVPRRRGRFVSERIDTDFEMSIPSCGSCAGIRARTGSSGATSTPACSTTTRGPTSAMPLPISRCWPRDAPRRSANSTRKFRPDGARPQTEVGLRRGSRRDGVLDDEASPCRRRQTRHDAVLSSSVASFSRSAR
jgi:hypothetical protein